MIETTEHHKAGSFGLVGCGHRGIVGFLASLRAIGRSDVMGALCDASPVRMQVAADVLQDNCSQYGDLDGFFAHPGLQTVIVATPDNTHADIVARAFAAGKDVVCEKPMATTLADCRRMIELAGGQDLRVAFNFRYNGAAREVKRLLMEGAIGNVLNVSARDDVAVDHGSDYFRRWHAFQACSGGLLVHKSTHTFDVVNWWLADRPELVSATAATLFYTPDRQEGTRCSTCSAQATCPVYVNLLDDVPGQMSAGIPKFYKRMYLDSESHDGYIRDRCVFDAANDVHDTYAVTVRYAGGTLFSYNAIFYAASEDRSFVLQGDRGRIEMSRAKRLIRLWNQEGYQEIDVPKESGGHDGADENLLRDMLGDGPGGQRATAEDGYWSLAIADCANWSIRTGSAQLVAGL